MRTLNLPMKSYGVMVSTYATKVTRSYKMYLPSMVTLQVELSLAFLCNAECLFKTQATEVLSRVAPSNPEPIEMLLGTCQFDSNVRPGIFQ